MKRSKILQNMYISRCEACVSATQEQLGQGQIGYTMFCVGYERYTRELRSLEFIP